MAFQNGSKVEVMNKIELPTSWCVAEVVSRNRHTYNLRYDYCYPRVEKVSREFIRPCPPSTKNWVVGDIVEVLDDSSWKTATLVCKVSDEGHFSLRLHGFAYEIIVHKSNIRTRQVWQHGQWIPIVKISGKYGNANMGQPNCDSKCGLQIPMPDGCEENDNNLLIYNDRLLKRASPLWSDATSNKKAKDGGFYEKEKLLLEPNNNNYSVGNGNSDNCSVGSCSNKCWSPNYETDLLSSDAESSNSPRDIHGLELHAYRLTLEALYAFGPLTWDKEALLTNLRITLHISNDEHLIHLRSLISTNKHVTYTTV